LIWKPTKASNYNPQKSKIITSPKKSNDKKPFKTIAFNGFEYNIPKLTDEYLSYRYGNWQTPVKDWNTATDDKALA
jgi:phosphorylcholine metabolism protein LicD